MILIIIISHGVVLNEFQKAINCTKLPVRQTINFEIIPKPNKLCAKLYEYISLKVFSE